MGTRRAAGFTLIEMMVTVALAVILISIAAPSMQDLVASQAVRSVSSELMTDFSYARADAVSYGRRVAIMRQTGVWEGGWRLVACVSPTVNPACAPLNTCDPTLVAEPCIEEPVRRTALGGRIKLCTRSNDDPVDTPALIFNPDGRLMDTAAGAMLHINTIMVSDDMGDADASNDKLRALEFGPTGRVSLHEVAAASGVACP